MAQTLGLRKELLQRQLPRCGSCQGFIHVSLPYYGLTTRKKSLLFDFTDEGFMKIYLARHGQSQWQVERDENWDTSLTIIGHEQAKRLAQWLASHQMIDNESRVEI